MAKSIISRILIPHNIINKCDINLCNYFLQSCLCRTHIFRNSKNERVPDFPQIPVCKYKKIIFRTYNYFRIKTRPFYGMVRRQGAGASKLRAWAIYDYWEKEILNVNIAKGSTYGTWAIKLDHLISIKLVLFHTYFIFLATSHNKPFLYYGET